MSLRGRSLLALIVAVPALLLSANGLASAEPDTPSPDVHVIDVPRPTNAPNAQVAALGCDYLMGQTWARYIFWAYQSDLVMDVKAQGGRNVIAYQYKGETNQIWVAEEAAQDGLYLHPCYDRWLCLDVEGARFENSVPLIVFRCNGQPNQRFYILPGGVIHTQPHFDKVLNIEGGIGGGNRVILWNDDGAVNSKWTVSKIG